MVFCRKNEARRQVMFPNATPQPLNSVVFPIYQYPISKQSKPQVCPVPQTPTTSSKQRIFPTSTPSIPQTNLCGSHSVTETRRKALKSNNKNGNPIRLPSKVLALITDPQDAGAVYVAESGGTARRLVLDVGKASSTKIRMISTA